jgi:hypothetical protein
MPLYFYYGLLELVEIYLVIICCVKREILPQAFVQY